MCNFITYRLIVYLKSVIIKTFVYWITLYVYIIVIVHVY